MITFLKRLFYRPVKLTCGTVNNETGETKTGYRTFDGDIIYKKDKLVSVWSTSSYMGVITRTTTITNWATGGTRDVKRKYPLYCETNIYNGKKRYFIDIDGKRSYIHTEAYERDNEIILI